MPIARALVALTVALPAAAFEALPSISFQAVRAAYQEQSAGIQQAQTGEIPGRRVIVPLPGLLNNVRKGALSVDLDGRRLQVFGNKSQNTKEWFIGFITDDGSVRLFKGRKALYLDSGAMRALAAGFSIFTGQTANNHLILEFYGRLYDVQVLGNASDRMRSQIVITPVKPKPGRAVRRDRRPDIGEVDADGPRRVIGTVQDLVEAGERAAYSVPLGGVEYKLFYGEGFLEDKHGEYGGPSGDLSVAVIYRDRAGKTAGFHWFVKDISKNQLIVSYPNIRGGVDNCRRGPSFGQMIMADGSLDFRLLAPAPDYQALEGQGRLPEPSPACLSAPKAD